MSQTTLYENDFLRVVEDEDGDALWIADELDECEVSLDTDQVEAVIPVLQKWLDERKRRLA